MMRLICLGLFLCLGGRLAWGEAADAQARVAIVGGVGTEDLAALMTAELSHSPGVVLVERDELGKAGDERQLQKLASGDAAGLGKMLGADGVIFLSKSEDGLQVR